MIMRVLFAAFLMFGLWLPAHAGPLDDPIEPQSVSAMLIERLEALPGVIAAERAGPEEIRVADADGGEMTVYTTNLLKELETSAPAARAAVVDRFVQTMQLAMGSTAGVPDAGQLRLTIYDDLYIEEIRRMIGEGEPDNQPLLRDLAPGLHIAMVEDSPNSVATLTRARLTEIGLTADQAWGIAQDGMDPLLDQVQLTDHGGLWQVSVDGYYDNAMMIFPDLWDRIAEVIGGVPVVTTPSRGLLVVARASDVENVDALRRLARDAVAQNPRPISERVFRWEGRLWVVE
ncbi:MAG: hypothetical protein AAF666_04355 [Pseudomonadota bacterium]